jgi:hypothetical protein
MDLKEGERIVAVNPVNPDGISKSSDDEEPQ